MVGYALGQYLLTRALTKNSSKLGLLGAVPRSQNLGLHVLQQLASHRLLELEAQRGLPGELRPDVPDPAGCGLLQLRSGEDLGLEGAGHHQARPEQAEAGQHLLHDLLGGGRPPDGTWPVILGHFAELPHDERLPDRPAARQEVSDMETAEEGANQHLTILIIWTKRLRKVSCAGSSST